MSAVQRGKAQAAGPLPVLLCRADHLAERLTLRDRQHDDRRGCLACRAHRFGSFLGLPGGGDSDPVLCVVSVT